jgi:endonuclease-3
MPRESFALKKERASKVVSELKRTYPDAHCELNFSNPLQLLIATILSAQCTDKQVNVVTESLFQKYRTAADFANAELPDLENDIRRIGLFRNKARSIKACCAELVQRFGGEVPRTLADLTGLAGVGRKTANVVLGNAFDVTEGVVVDTHVARLSQRLGFTKEVKAEKIEADLMKLIPREEWTMLSHLLIWHGRRRCFARNPDCPECEARDLCPSRDLNREQK